MTREQILNMTAQELAEATAVHVMGWTEGDHPEVNGTGQWMAEYEFPVYFKKDGSFISSLNWDPAEDISAAMEVAELLQRRKFYFHLLKNAEMMWFANFRAGGLHARATTAPEAICKAALLAVMGI